MCEGFLNCHEVIMLHLTYLASSWSGTMFKTPEFRFDVSLNGSIDHKIPTNLFWCMHTFQGEQLWVITKLEKKLMLNSTHDMFSHLKQLWSS